MSSKETAQKKDETPEEVKETITILAEYADDRDISLKRAAEDVTGDWSQGWCRAVPSDFAESVRSCVVTEKIESVVEESDEYEDPERLIRRAVPEISEHDP